MIRATRRTCSALLVTVALWALLALPHRASAQSIAAGDWVAYKTKFLGPNGRIVDNANGNISHSEGQGYGMLLSIFADSRPDFDLIWSFTRTELLLRDDGLAAWKWDPAATPHVSDANNATDGDILIAYALALAGSKWSDPKLTDVAKRMEKSIAARAVIKRGGHFIILPAISGFGPRARSDGPVVNPSYWIFEAFPVFAKLDPTFDWARVSADGRWLIEHALIGPRRLPPDWLSARGGLAPAKGFPAQYGYNGLRIPLYLVRGGNNQELAAAVAGGMTVDGKPAIIDLRSGKTVTLLDDPGYRSILALADCAANGTPFPDGLKAFEPTLYYPSTLHLLVLDYVNRHKGACR